MPWTKPLGTVTAEAANEDLQLGFYFSDAAATPPNTLRVRLRVKNDGGGGAAKEDETVDRPITASGLTAGEQTTLLSLLAKLRDNGLTALGYTQT